MYKTFAFTGAKKIIFGNNAITDLPQQLAQLEAQKPLVLLDQGLLGLGIPEMLADIFSKAQITYALCSDIAPEPTLAMADAAAACISNNGADVVIGIGGGSAMDTAKAAAMLATCGGKASDYIGLNKVPKAGLPTIMIPTTAGTGSEVTFTAVFVNSDLKKKQGINSPFLYPDIALLDPALTLSVPPTLTATTGVDALCHAIESYTSLNASPMSEIVSLQAISLIGANLRECVHNGANLEAREKMLLGSLYAGLGLANAGVTAVHSLSYPLGGRYGVPHGLANTLLLPAVIGYNIPAALSKFTMVAKALGEETEGIALREAAGLAQEAVLSLIYDCGITTKMQDLGIEETDFPALAKEAMEVARPLANNPRRLGIDDAVDIYGEAF